MLNAKYLCSWLNREQIYHRIPPAASLNIAYAVVMSHSLQMSFRSFAYYRVQRLVAFTKGTTNERL